MGTFVSISGGDNANVHIYGNGSVVASGGNDTFSFGYMPGSNAVVAGNGNDTIQIDGNGNITVGAGSDLLTLNGSGYILQNNSGGMVGHDTINLGSGNDSLTEAGSATVYGAFGSATVEGGKFQFLQVKVSGSGSEGSSHGEGDHGGGDDGHSEHGGGDHGGGRYDSGNHDGGNQGKGMSPDCHTGGSTQYVYQDLAISGNATLLGGSNATQFIAGSGSVVMQGGSGNDTFMGGSGQSMMTGGTGHNLFEVAGFSGIGGTDVITNFVSGNDQLYLEGQSLAYLQSQHDISTSGGNTLIKLDGGQTTVELKGFTSLASSDITTHKG